MADKTNEDLMKNWRVVTPILLMVLTGIMTWAGFTTQAYLGQIAGTVQEVRMDLKNYMKESGADISDLKTRITVLENKK